MNTLKLLHLFGGTMHILWLYVQRMHSMDGKSELRLMSGWKTEETVRGGPEPAAEEWSGREIMGRLNTTAIVCVPTAESNQGIRWCCQRKSKRSVSLSLQRTVGNARSLSFSLQKRTHVIVVSYRYDAGMVTELKHYCWSCTQENWNLATMHVLESLAS